MSRNKIAHLQRGNFEEADLAFLIGSEEPELERELLALADAVRREQVGAEVHLRALIEISNYCRCRCLYCGLRAENQEVPRYRMEPEEIIATAKTAAKCGYGTVVLQAGEDLHYSDELIAKIITEITNQTSLAVTLSLGERKREAYALWRKAGANRYLLRHESENPKLFASLHPGRELNSRTTCLQNLRELGYEVGSGFMVGLPGQSDEILARDLLLLQKLDVDMVGIGAFIPSSQTPLGKAAAGDLRKTMRTVALARLLLPKTNIPATTAMGTIERNGQEQVLAAGANVLMPNLTPEKYRRLYQIYPGKFLGNTDPQQQREEVVARIEALGRKVGSGAGPSLRYQERKETNGTYSPSK